MIATPGIPTVQEPKFVKGERLFNFRARQWVIVATTPRSSGASVGVSRDGYVEYRRREEFFPGYIRPARQNHRRPTPDALDTEQTEHRLLKHVVRDTPANPKIPTHTDILSEKLKHYVINYLDAHGQFHVERIAAKGLVSAVSIFYVMQPGTAVVSVICIL